MMKKILIWGIGNRYNELKNIIDFEVLKGNIEIVAMVSRDKYANYVDGKKVIDKNEIENYEYDYIVIFAEKFAEIKDEILTLGIGREKIIDGSIFKIPCFDFSRYSSLIENPVTIISDDCWGGMIYKYLKLKATSPFRNLEILQVDYIKLLSDLEYYLNSTLELEREGNVYNGMFPIGKLGQGDKKIFLNFNHFFTFEESKYEWEKRKNRINFNRLFVKMSYPIRRMYRGEEQNEDVVNMIKKFLELKYPNKICFSTVGVDNAKVILSNRYIESIKSASDSKSLGEHIREIENFTKEIDLLKLLCGEKNFIRES